ncbi:MAG: hypothetical protein GEU88_08940 [Solirubrobacterales bacterium]|nr:hypothetical protein [Solirubrobacterales bacterium]
MKPCLTYGSEKASIGRDLGTGAAPARVVTRPQLLERGVNSDAIQHRIEKRRLHPVRRGVYILGRPELTQHGVWMAAVLSCGPAAVLSHTSGAALWGPRCR